MSTQNVEQGHEQPGAVQPRRRRSQSGLNTLDQLERFGLFLLFIAVVIVFGVWRPDTFATAANFRTIATTQSVTAIAALALIFPLVGGRFDLSVGANLGLCSVATAAAMSKANLPLVPAIAVGLAFGSAIGLINGVVVGYLGVSSLIGSLGMSTVIAGVVTGYTDGIPIGTNLSPTLTDLGANTVAGLPVLFLIMIVISIVTWYVLNHTPYGRRLAAVGSNLRASRLMGIPARKIVVLSFVASGLLAGMAGVLQVAAQGSGNPQVSGLTFILPAIAATFLGATTWQPGRFNVPGTIVALFFLGTTISGLALIGAAPWITDVFNGTAIVVAVALSAQFRRRRMGELEIGE
jgi:ribose transport system permease protein